MKRFGILHTSKSFFQSNFLFPSIITYLSRGVLEGPVKSRIKGFPWNNLRRILTSFHEIA